jgi:hypothetical protein
MLMNDERQTTTLCNFKVSLFHSLQTHGRPASLVFDRGIALKKSGIRKGQMPAATRATIVLAKGEVVSQRGIV